MEYYFNPKPEITILRLFVYLKSRFNSLFLLFININHYLSVIK